MSKYQPSDDLIFLDILKKLWTLRYAFLTFVGPKRMIGTANPLWRAKHDYDVKFQCLVPGGSQKIEEKYDLIELGLVFTRATLFICPQLWDPLYDLNCKMTKNNHHTKYQLLIIHQSFDIHKKSEPFNPSF